MLEETQIMTASNTTNQPGSPDQASNPSPSVDSAAVAEGGRKQDPETNAATNRTPCPAETPQAGDQLVPPPDSEAAGDGQTPEEPQSAAASLRAETARRNGCKSHGPTTEEGKSRSRLNALKHGLRSETILLETSSEAEKAVFEDLRTRVEEEFAPRTFEEKLLLESLVHAIWQKRRCLHFETKELRTDFIFHGPVMDRILRYATSADKRLFRALNELKRLQKEDPPQPDDPDIAPQAEGE
ncbi:MAG: hypothetical protein LAP86_29185 [Acidobacteriia bacterium]|nr:hypothetical protein [Terriglobia bacterium]